MIQQKPSLTGYSTDPDFFKRQKNSTCELAMIIKFRGKIFSGYSRMRQAVDLWYC